MASEESQKLRERIEETVKSVKLHLERSRELGREVEKHAATLRRLAGTE